ncbi:DUF4424 family protein [Janthinobacterium fluminis]|uniref:DUF4424 family protein n=1 Tax=Janthinobacterium fluminis TaxID=2987524 RepID=A0ABT5K8C5_9BURK|nr:DUF4424 family protein [Janthinobacterium fluminis]MDC8760720.1 DUF4424 family protein [Janthinobacterium fluminis]
MNKQALALLLALGAPAIGSANDGIVAQIAGGIVFGKTAAVAMKREVLNVSYDKVSVDYDFLNESDVDVVETISFPLPEYTAKYQESPTYYGQPGDFSILVDGKAAGFRTVLAARQNGRDVGDVLRRIGLTDAQIAYYPAFSPFDQPVAPLTARQEKALIENGLMAKLTDEESWVPNWSVQIHYVWKQKFPAKKMVHVYHQYRPFVQAGTAVSVSSEAFPATHCADAAFYKAWRRIGAENGDGQVAANQVAYILKTGNTWKNGIEDFTLNLVKRNPAELISLCFPGTFRKINPTTLQVRLKHFKPAQDLNVYFGNIGETGVGNGVQPALSP